MRLQVTGAVIRAALEHGLATAAEEVQPGRFPKVSGIRYAWLISEIIPLATTTYLSLKPETVTTCSASQHL